MFAIRHILQKGYMPHILRRHPVSEFRCPKWFSIILSFLIDVLSILSFFVLLTLFDCGELGGSGRLPHLACMILGSFFGHIVYKRMLFRPLSWGFGVALELALLVAFFLLWPFRFLFWAIFRLLSHFLLIWRHSYDKILKKKEMKRFIKAQLREAAYGFLPLSMVSVDLLGRFAEGNPYGRNQKNSG
jgi:hypothetical protein